MYRSTIVSRHHVLCVCECLRVCWAQTPVRVRVTPGYPVPGQMTAWIISLGQLCAAASPWFDSAEIDWLKGIDKMKYDDIVQKDQPIRFQRPTCKGSVPDCAHI